VSTVTRFGALGVEFTIDAPEPLRSELHRMWHLCRLPEGAGGEAVRLVVRDGADGVWVLELDGEERFRAPRPGPVVAALVWEVNQAAVGGAGDRGDVVVHAAGVVVGDTAVLLPGPSGSGKSTLVARLVADGLDYLSDEAVAIRAGERRAIPYPKPVTIEPASQDALARFTPDAAIAALHEPEWNLPPAALRSRVVAREAPIRVVVVAAYAPAASCTTTEVSRAEGLAALAQQAFHLRTGGARVFRELERVVRGCRCYRLDYGDVGRASAAVRSLAEIGSHP
jgi:hypothetical protein